MRIQNISTMNTLPKAPAFKSNITFDIGGSQREGSCKIYYATSENDDEIYTAKTTVNPLGKTRFENSNDFIDQIVKKVKKVQDNNVKNVKDMGYPPEENILKSITLFIPSYTSGTHAYYLPNHKNTDDRPLKDLNFGDLKTKLKNNGVKISDDLQVRILQDAMGTGLATTKKLYDLGMLQKGKYYTACITGGGCGVSNIEMTDDDTVIIKSTGSGYLAENGGLMKVSKAGASAPALIQNFCRTFGLNEEMVEDIKNCHKAEFVLQNPVTFERNVKTERLRDLLLDTGKYEMVNQNDKKFTVQVKDDYVDLYDRARRSAIRKYCHAFARLAIIKKNEGSNGLIITGPTAKAINNTAKEHYNRDIKSLVTDYIFSYYNTYELEKMQDTYNFEIICDERFFIDDNTACKKFAHTNKFVSPERGNWVKVSVDSLKDHENM